MVIINYYELPLSLITISTVQCSIPINHYQTYYRCPIFQTHESLPCGTNLSRSSSGVTSVGSSTRPTPSRLNQLKKKHKTNLNHILRYKYSRFQTYPDDSRSSASSFLASTTSWKSPSATSHCFLFRRDVQ